MRFHYVLKPDTQELDVLDNMLVSLVEVLEEKGVLTQEEWEKKIKFKITRDRGLPKYRDLQFSDK